MKNRWGEGKKIKKIKYCKSIKKCIHWELVNLFNFQLKLFEEKIGWILKMQKNNIIGLRSKKIK